MAKIGTLIDGKYEVLREIGRGGMSVVYLAMDTRLNKQWAVKEIARKANDANNEIVVSSLLAEANLMKKLDHPSLPRIVDIIEEHDTIYVVMDYIEGEPLSKILELYGAQDQDQVIEWGKQLCDVLFYLHNCEPPIIYRDMKPANVMLRPDGTVKLIDFGIAREYKRAKTADTESLGTRGYAAPEQFGGKGQTDARTDIYCFGVTLYHLVTGLNPCEPPYELYPIKQVNPNFYDGLQYLIQKCTQMNPEDRFQSCDEIRYVLDNIQEFDKGRRIRQKKRLNSFIALVVCSIVFAILGTGMIFGAKKSLDASLTDNIKNVQNASGYSILSDAYDNIMGSPESNKKSKYNSSEQLEFLAVYMEKIVSMHNEEKIDMYSINIQQPDDIMSVVQAELEDVNDLDEGETIYDNLSDEQITNLVKYCIYHGEMLFGSATVDAVNYNNFAEAKRVLAILFDENNGLLNIKDNYDTTELPDELVDKAKNYYYSSVIYTYFTKDDSQVSNDLYQTAANDVDIVKCFDEIIKSLELTENTSSDVTKRSMYVTYYRMLEDQSNIKDYKSKNISKNDVAAIYKALYGEDYMIVYKRVLDLSTDGTFSGFLNNQRSELEYDETKGIYSIEKWSPNSNFDTINDNRANIAHYIYLVYGE